MSAGHRVRVSGEELARAVLELTGERHHYLATVRRARLEDDVELFDGAGRVRSTRIAVISGEAIRLEATAEPREVTSSVRVTSLLPLIKGERMELAIAKLTELGVSAIIPVRCERCVVALSGERAERRVARFIRIAADAARQSGRADVPTIAPITDFAGALAAAGDCQTRLVFDPGATGSLREALAIGTAPPADEGFALLTGPEGGLSEAEVASALAAGFAAIGLGPRILRAETAAMTCVASVLTLVGDLGGRVCPPRDHL